jgi:hypothetical protein
MQATSLFFRFVFFLAMIWSQVTWASQPHPQNLVDISSKVSKVDYPFFSLF